MPATVISGIVGAAIAAVVAIGTGCCYPYWKKKYDDWENLDNTHIKNVDDEAIKLTRKRFNIERHVNTANHGKHEVTKVASEDWTGWKKEADDKIIEWENLMSEYEEAEKSCCKMCLCLSSTKLVAKMKNIEEKMQKLHEKMDVNKALKDINTSTSSGNRSDENRSELSWLDKIVEKILKLLETWNKIGVHGDPYIGKTMIVKALEDKVKKDCSFEDVFFVTMKEGEGEEQIRQHIAKQLKISIEVVSDAIRSDKYLLILDQVSEDIALDMLASSPWKVLVVTRYFTVCEKMGLDDYCKVERMDEEDARRFFSQQINNGSLFSIANKYLVAQIVKECGVFPQLIKVVAAYLQRQARDWNVSDWEEFRSNLSNNNQVEDVYKTLQVVLKKIGNDEEKCYVYASLLPPEKDIFKDYLIECWWAHGCIKSDAENNLGHPLRTTRLKGHHIIQDLLKGCFLIEGGEENCVRIPNICRDWVFETEKHVLYLDANSQIKPEDVVNAIHISLMENNTSITIESLDYNPICTLFLRHQNEALSIIGRISDCIFLRVLDLSHAKIVVLPAAIFKLANLKALYLNDCKGLRELPLDIGTPTSTSLEILDICRSGIQAIPKGIAKLHGLKCLRVSLAILGSYDETTRIFEGLTSLEEFTAVKDGNLEENWDGLASAIKDLAMSGTLNVLCFTFPNASGLEDFVCKSKSVNRKENLWRGEIFRSFTLLVDCPKKHHDVLIPQPTEFHLRIFEESSNQSLFSKVMKQTTILELINHTSIEYLSSFGMDNMMKLKVCVISSCQNMNGVIRCKGNFSALTTMTIKSCSKLKVIFPADVVEQIPSLKYLKVEKCQNTSMIFGEGRRSPTIVKAPLLECLELIELQSLRSICAEDQLLVFLSLREMTVQSCPCFEDSSLDKICTKSDVQLKCEEDLKKKLESKETYFKCHPIPAFQPESYDGGKKVVGGSTKGKAKLVAKVEQHDTHQNRQQSVPSRTLRLEKGESSKQNDYNHSPEATKSESKGEVSPAGILKTPSEVMRLDSHISGNAQSTKLSDDSESNVHLHEVESSKQNDYNQSPEAPKSDRKDEISPIGSLTTPTEVTSLDSKISGNATKISDNSDSHVHDHEAADKVPAPLQLVALKSAYESILKVRDNLNRSADDPEILEETRDHLRNLAEFNDIGLHKETFNRLTFVLNDVEIKNKNAANVLAKYRDLKLKRAEALASKSYIETKQKELGTTQVEDLPGKLSINRNRWEEDIQKYEDEMRKLEEAVKIAEEEQKQMKETLKDMAKSLEVKALVTYIEQEVGKFNV